MRGRGEQLAGPARVPQDQSRLVLLSYHFPPGQSVGGLRWQMLAQLADEHGWAMDVVTVHPNSLAAPDPARLSQLPASTRVYGVELPSPWIERVEDLASRTVRRIRPRPTPPAVVPDAAESGPAQATWTGSLAREEIRWQPTRPRDWVRAYYALRTHWQGRRWGVEAARLAETILEPGLHRAVLSSGPPHVIHDAARALAGRAGLPFVFDMRDPWRLVQRLPEEIASPVAYRLAEQLERRAVAAAALVVTNTGPARDQLRALYPDAADRIIAVMNGYDEDPLPASRHGSRFVLAYAGTIYLDRDPRPLFRAAARVIAELGLEPGQFGIEMIGNADSYGGVPVSQIGQEEGIGAFVRTGPARPRGQAMEFLAEATMLVSLPQDSDLAIPSKIFEYLRFQAWVLVLAEPGSATAEALKGTSVDVIPPGDVEGMAQVLRGRLAAHLRGERPKAPVGIDHLSRRAQAQALFSALDQRIGPPTGRSGKQASPARSPGA